MGSTFLWGRGGVGGEGKATFLISPSLLWPALALPPSWVDSGGRRETHSHGSHQKPLRSHAFCSQLQFRELNKIAC